MWDKLLKFPAHPPYKPIRSTHEQRSETGASKRTKISCGSRRGRQGSSRVVRGRQGSSGVVRGRQGSSGVVRSRQGSSGVVRGRQGSSGVVRGRQESSGVVRGRQGSSGVVRGRQESSAIEVVRVVRSRQLELDNCCCHLCVFVCKSFKFHNLLVESKSTYINPMQIMPQSRICCLPASAHYFDGVAIMTYNESLIQKILSGR